MPHSYVIRTAIEGDAQELLNIYSPYVRDTIISFEYEVPSLAEFKQRIITNTEEYPWLVCLYEGKIIGYAYGSKHRYRTAYQWSPESTVYMLPGFHRKGIARVLYETLFNLLRLQGYFNVYAGVALPNDKSVGFHKALGFDELGIFKKVGYKHGNWHDTHWFQLHLFEHALAPLPPKKTAEVENSAEFATIINQANEKLNQTAEL